MLNYQAVDSTTTVQGDIINPSVMRRTEASTSARARVRHVRHDPIGAKHKVDSTALRGLAHLRSGIAAVVQKEKYNLKEALHTATLALSEKQERLREESDGLQFVRHKVEEKTDVHRKAVEEYNRAHDMLTIARLDHSSPTPADLKASMKSFVTMCESLVKSWSDHVQVHAACVSLWGFKANRQSAFVTRIFNELSEAEANEFEARTIINEDLTEVQAVSDLLEDL